ncbi:protein of unknown function [Nitrospira defluvii]|uniref:Uncharacterized protein n=1 Tax=Nitrospira defluvii TaxID=330214 RepID=D8PBT5_9BACT|nr:protein of unknown function [Nitrospira defluvii]
MYGRETPCCSTGRGTTWHATAPEGKMRPIDAAREARVSSDQSCGVYLAFFKFGDSLKYGVHISTMRDGSDPT